MSMRRDEAWYREQCARNDRFKVGTVNRPAADTPAAPPPASGGASLRVGDIVTYDAADGPPIALVVKSKYRNKPTNGYASIKESKRAFQLKLMQEAGQIRNLREQVSYLLIPKQDGERSAKFIVDFTYEEWAGNGWRFVAEDVKGLRTDVYILKRKMLRFLHGIAVRET